MLELDDRQIALLDTLPYPQWVFDPESLRILFANQSASQWLGYPVVELMSRTVLDLRPPEDHEALRTRVQRYDWQPCSVGTWRLLTSMGSFLKAEFHWQPTRLHGRRAIFATATDVTRLTELQVAHLQLTQRHKSLQGQRDVAIEHFKPLFETLPGNFLILMPGDYEIVAVSDAYAQVTMTERQRILGRKLFDVFPDNPGEPGADGVATLRKSLQRVEQLLTTDVMPMQRYPIRRADGLYEERYWTATNKPVVLDGQGLSYIIHHAEDVTPLFRLERRGSIELDKGAVSSAQVRELLVETTQLRNALARVHEQDARWRTAEELLGLGAWEYDLDSGNLSWSSRAFEIYGQVEGQYTPNFDSYLALVHPDDLQAMLDNYGEFLDSGANALHFQHRVVHPDGKVVHLHGVAERHDKFGRQVLVGFVQDITDLVSIQQNLTRAKRLIQIAGDKAKLGGWRMLLNQDHLEWTEQTAAIHDVSFDQPPTLSDAIDFYLPEYRLRVMESFRRCVEHGEPYDEILQILTKKGRRVWVRSIGAPERDADGTIIGAHGAFQDISELMQARARSDLLQRRLFSTLENMGDAFVLISNSLEFVYLNQKAEQLLTKPRIDLIDRHVWAVFPAMQDSPLAAFFDDALNNGTPDHLDFHYTPDDIWFSVDVYPGPEGLAVYFRDVSEERAREMQLNLLENAVKRLNDLVLITEAQPIEAPHGPRIVYVNDALVKRTGYSREELIGKTPRMLQGPKTSRKELDRIRMALQTGGALRTELCNYSRSGEEIWLEIDLVPIESRKGELTHYVAIERDVTERRRVDEAIRVSEERFRLVTRAANDVIWDWDFAHQTIWWNEGIERVFGYRRDALPPGEESWVNHIHPDDKNWLLANVAEFLEGPGTNWDAEYRFIKADGETAYVYDRGFVIRNSEGQPLRMLGSMLDLTEKRQLEQRLRESQKLEAMGQLTGGVAHDFNNLLTVILGNAEIMSDQLPSNTPLRAMAEMTVKAAERGAELTSRLLAFARRQTLLPKVVDANALIASCEPLFRRTLTENVQIVLQPAQGLWPIEVDPGQLEVALLNLVINARDALPSGGQISISTRNLQAAPQVQADTVRQEAHVEIVVTDNGEGMDRAVVSRAFEPFFTTKEIGKGSGLGLSMVFGFVKQSAGNIRIESEPGVGTSVHLIFPRCANAADVQAEALVEDTPAGGMEHVLVVEDDDLVREHLTTQLRGLGYRVTSTNTGPRALDILRQLSTIELLLTDIVMPGGLNGRELAQQAQQLRPNLKVLFSSGYSQTQVEAGAEDHLEPNLLRKPYRRQELAKKIRQVLTQADFNN